MAKRFKRYIFEVVMFFMLFLNTQILICGPDVGHYEPVGNPTGE